jgi:spore coat protein U-like protein
MKLKLIQLLTTLTLLFPSFWAHAAITCTAPTSTGFSTAYSSTGVVPNVTQGTVSFTCTRSAAGDATNLYLRADNGVNILCLANAGAFLGTCIYYEAYRDSGCTALWTDNTNASSIPVTLSSVLTPQPITVNFWGCIKNAGQTPLSGAGTYSDTVAISIRDTTNGFTVYSTGTFSVNITYPATCSITNIDSVAFGTYEAFRATPLAATNANIELSCTPQLPYTMSLDANSGVVVGLNYTLTINSQTPPVSSRNPGPTLAQTHTINGTMPANQAGTCTTSSCAGLTTHTLTITY